MITFKKVSKRHSNGFLSLNALDLFIPENEFVYLIGPSGAGKSSILRLLFMDELVSSGEIIVDKFVLSELRYQDVPYYRRHVGMIFQDYKLLPRRTVYENIAFALVVMHTNPKKIKEQVNYALDLVGLISKKDNYVHELSGGEQQRVCIARAIVNQPEILLCDEPTGNLDPETSWEIVHLLNKINAYDTTVIMATHDTEIVNGMPKRVVALEQGTVARDQLMGAYVEA